MSDYQAENSARLKNEAAAVVDALLPKLTQAAQAVHGFAELQFEEHQSARVLVDLLQELGFSTTTGVAGMTTAFTAEAGGAGPKIGFLAEYDALRGIGHGCAHNLIGPTSIGAAAAVKALLDRGEVQGRIGVLGTPAEEGGGGKVIMVEAGILDDYDAAMMIHPANRTQLDHGTLAMSSYTVEFFGRSSHAAAEPEKGINALDAIIQTFTGINALRQQVTEDVRMHGIITHGGDAANIIPEYTRGEFILRARRREAVDELSRRFRACVEAAALATGCTFKITADSAYKDRRPNPVLLDLFARNLRGLGWQIQPKPESGGIGSSDMGDVTQAVPAIHPYMAMAPAGITWHSRDVHELAVGEEAWKMVAAGAKAMAFTALDLLTSPDQLAAARAAFQTQVR